MRDLLSEDEKYKEKVQCWRLTRRQVPGERDRTAQHGGSISSLRTHEPMWQGPHDGNWMQCIGTGEGPCSLRVGAHWRWGVDLVLTVASSQTELNVLNASENLVWRFSSVGARFRQSSSETRGAHAVVCEVRAGVHGALGVGCEAGLSQEEDIALRASET